VQNLRKIILFVLPTTVAQGLAITSVVFLVPYKQLDYYRFCSAAIVIGMPAPLTPIQVLFVNMVTAVTLGIVLALGA
jgi:magnesium-transporting ATPase (P-type)